MIFQIKYTTLQDFSNQNQIFALQNKEVKESLEIRKDMRCKEGQHFYFVSNDYESLVLWLMVVSRKAAVAATQLASLKVRRQRKRERESSAPLRLISCALLQ